MNATPPRSAAPLDSDIAAMAFVQASTLFQGLPPERLGALFEQGEVVEYAPGDAVYLRGARDDALYLVVSGSVLLRAQAAGAPVDVVTLERHAVFGETAVLTSRPHTFTAVARTHSRLVRIPGELVRGLADEVPKIGRRLAALMAARSRAGAVGS